MKRILTNKDGVTILEGVIALGLLALVAGGAFAVLLSASRQTTQPNAREELVWSVEGLNDELKVYTAVRDFDGSKNFIPNRRLFTNSDNPLRGGTYNNVQQNSGYSTSCERVLTYKVEDKQNAICSSLSSEQMESTGCSDLYKVEYDVSCDGWEL